MKLLCCFPALLWAATTPFASTGSATWGTNPSSGDWNTAASWMPNTAPNSASDIATFVTSAVTQVSLSSGVSLDSLIFNPGADSFSLRAAAASLSFYGDGVVNNSGQTQYFTVEGSPDLGQGGSLVFYDNSTAGDATITGYPSGNNSIGSGGFIFFYDNSSAAHATIILNGATAPGIAAAIGFLDSSTPADATLIANGGIGGMGSVISLAANGGAARIEVFGNAFLSAGFVAPGLTTGSIEGDGRISMGPYNISVGANNLSTTFSGAMQGGTGSSLTKIGTGTLTLAGASTYPGGTTLTGGGLRIDNTTGSGTGSGPLTVNAGTLSGKGIIAGAVTIGNGSGGGAFLAPAAGGPTPVTLTAQGVLTFKADGSYTCTLSTKRAQADQVSALGVTIASAAQFKLQALAKKRLTTGQTFVVLNNTASTPISGTFTNLADGATLKSGNNKFQARYTGGDGNDLTLTVE